MTSKDWRQNPLQSYDDPYGIAKHCHCYLLCIRRKRCTEDSLLHIGIRARCDNFLHLLQKLRVKHPVCFVQDKMAYTVD